MDVVKKRGTRVLAVALVAAAALVVSLAAGTASAGQTKTLKVFGAYATAIEEPWDGVIHRALEKAEKAGKIDYSFTDELGYSGEMERTLREVVAKDKPDIIFGDAFGNEDAVRRVAKANPKIAFVFGSGGGPVSPNFSVFDNWIHEPAYLLGVLAGGLTKTNKLGVVAAMPVPEVNRLTNAFIAGALSVNKKVTTKVTFINSWFDPATAKDAALAQIGAGVDVLYAERAGVIEAAVEKNKWVFGNMSDQRSLGPKNVVSSAVWNMSPTVDYIVSQVAGGTYTSMELKDFSMVAKGGASLAAINAKAKTGVPAALVAKVNALKKQINAGTFRVDINEAQPAGSTSVAK